MLRVFGVSLAVTTLLAGAANAGSDMIRRDVVVTYRAADLSTEGGASAVLARIDKAAKEACGSSPAFYSTYPIAPSVARKDFAKCRAGAVNAAVTKLNAPLLTNVYARNEEAQALRLAGR